MGEDLVALVRRKNMEMMVPLAQSFQSADRSIDLLLRLHLLYLRELQAGGIEEDQVCPDGITYEYDNEWLCENLHLMDQALSRSESKEELIAQAAALKYQALVNQLRQRPKDARILAKIRGVQRFFIKLGKAATPYQSEIDEYASTAKELLDKVGEMSPEERTALMREQSRPQTWT